MLGTAAYMNPEQARGEKVDKRADVWSFGVVVYEMVTGQQLFTRGTISATLAAVLTFEPDWNRVPPVLHRPLRACLEKDSQRRLHDIADVPFLLEQTPQNRRGRQETSVGSVYWSFRNHSGLDVVVGVARHTPISIRAAALMRLEVDLGRSVSLGSVFGSDIIISPDGTRLAYLSNLRLFTRQAR